MSILPNISNWKYSKFIKNNKYFFKRKYVLKIVSPKILKKAYKVVSGWKGYNPTPLISLTKLNIIASGGVADLTDLTKLKKIKNKNFIGVISGKAIYEKRFSVKEAIKILEG